MKKTFLKTLAGVLLCGVVNAQTPPELSPQLPQELPQLPQAAALTQNSLGGTSLFTGRAQVSIPMYTVKVGDFSLPVSLQYNSGGFKIDENPTFEGLSWSLSCTGVISRSVHGKPDDDPDVIRVWQPASNSFNDVRSYYEKNVEASEPYDAEPDQFSVSAPGLTGFQFIKDNNGQIIQFPYTNNKITIGTATNGQYLSFTVTAPNGYIYEFGGVNANDKIIQHNFGGAVKNRGGMYNSFYLTKITLPDGQYIEFQYTGFDKTVYSGTSESMIRGQVQAGFACPNNGPSCASYYGDPNSYARKANYQLSILKTVSEITASNGQHIIFHYGNTPPNEGNVTATCLTSVDISSGDYQRTYNLTYTMPRTSTLGYAFGNGPDAVDKNVHTRFFLSSVSYTMPNTSYAETVQYKLDYADNDLLPPNLSCAQDHLGYFNGAANSTLLPWDADPNGLNWLGFASAERGYNPGAAARGMLDKITYPTGGFEKFNYEGNTVSVFGHIADMKDVEVNGYGYGNTLHLSEYTSAPFHIGAATTGTLSANVPGGPNVPYGLQNVWIEPLAPGASLIYITDNNTPTSVSLPAGDYILHLKCFKNNTGHALLTYYRDEDGWTNKYAGGVRVRSIDTYDPLSEKVTSKYFTYMKKDDILLSKGSGSSSFTPVYIQPGLVLKKCPGGDNCQGCAGFGCDIYTLSSSSVIPHATFGEHMSYEYVIESDDASFAHGGIQHRFDVQHPLGIDVATFGINIVDLPMNTITSSFGNETETLVFDKGYAPVKNTVTVFDNSPGYIKEATAKCYRRSQIGPVDNPLSTQSGYMETDYHYQSFWNRPVSVSTTDYANGITTTNTNSYTYNELPAAAPTNTEPIKTETTDSKNLVLKTQMTYPTDYPSDPVSQAMVTKNMISPVINIKQFRGGTEIKSTTTHYKDWLTSGAMIKPETVSQSLKGNTEETRIRYYGYDANGNPVKMSKENDVVLQYVWGYNQTFPVAEVNSDKPVYYSSFEEISTQAAWTGISKTYFITSADAMTGKNYYQANNFDLYTGTLTGDYLVTYWCDNATGYSVTGTLSGWPKLLKTVTHGSKTWRLFEHKVNASVIHVTGSGALDELRAYAADGQMKTFTYSPFVGVSSQCDQNNSITYFEYDGLQRLALVRDIDRNILKKICYNYAGQPENCGVVHYGNQEQTRTLTRNNCPPNTTPGSYTVTVPANTYFSTIDDAHANQQAIDYLDQNAQAIVNANASCTPITYTCDQSNCTGKCINNVCEQGTTGLIQRYRVKENGIFVWYCDLRICYSDHTYYDSIGDSCPSPVPALTTCP